MKVLCKYNNPDNPPKNTTSDFNYGLELEKEYLVMGMILCENQLWYLIDEGNPNFYPKGLFDITDSRLSQRWYFKTYSEDEEMYPYVQAIWGYYELVSDEVHYEQLVGKEREVLELYFKRKREIEKKLISY